MDYWRLLLLLILLLAETTLAPAAVKRWRYNTNFNNPENWSQRRVPCPLERVVFPKGFKNLGVLLPDGTTELRQLVLPSDGEIILPSSGQLSFGENPSNVPAGCDTGDNVFTRTGFKAWLDPASWIPEADDPSEATPHLERIPCLHDVAVFPEDASIAVRLPQLVVSVSGVQFGSKLMTPSDWLELLSSPGGWRFLASTQTLRGERVQLTNKTCSDPAGCECLQPNQLLLMDLVCSYGRAQCEDQGTPLCYNPVIPHGHCCALCGSFLVLDFERSVFSLAFLKEHVLQVLQDEGAADRINFHVSRIHGDKVQLVLVDKGSYSGDSVEMGDKLYSSLVDNVQLGVKTVQLVMSGGVLQPDALARQMGLVFGTLLASVAMLAAIFLVFVTCRDRLPVLVLNKQLFVFARYQNLEGDSDAVEVMAAGPAEPLRYDVDDENHSKSFDNPMYGQGKASHEAPVYSEIRQREETREQLEVTQMTELSPHISREDGDEDIQELVEIDIEEK